MKITVAHMDASIPATGRVASGCAGSAVVFSPARERGARRIRIASIALVAFAAAAGHALARQDRAEPPASAPPPVGAATHAGATPFAQAIPAAAYKIEMMPVPGSADGKIAPFWMSRTEVTWEAYDVFAYRLDDGDEADTETRPTKPYLPPDRGFGHEGYAAISTTHKSVTKFCEWLTTKSGKKFRLATEDEWEHACRGGGSGGAGAAPTKPGAVFFGAGEKLEDYAWFAGNAAGTPHPVGKKKPNPLGLHDMLGNVREWVNGRDGKPTTKGGCYLDGAEKLTIGERANQEKSWNQTDPQVPKSTWWLSDGPFAGFRIVCEADPKDPTKPAAAAAGAPVERPEPATPAPATVPPTKTPSPEKR